jgi:hypothetical protein
LALPSTAAEWQEAVDLAEFLLTLDSARQYGLVTGGPTVNVDRCAQLLEEGAARGITPSSDAAERLTEAYQQLAQERGVRFREITEDE